jgi:hypothetical protein
MDLSVYFKGLDPILALASLLTVACVSIKHLARVILFNVYSGPGPLRVYQGTLGTGMTSSPSAE